jgi:glutamine transport system substrate-binding protein
MKKLLFALIVLFAAVAWIVLANIPNQASRAQINAAKHSLLDINVGTVYFYPPFIYNESIGFDMVLLEKLCKQAGYRCHIVPESLAQLFADLQQGKVDMAISAIARTPERSQDVDFSVPYLTLNQAGFIGLKSLAPLAQLKNIKIGVVQDSLFERYLRAKPLFSASVVSYPYNNDLFTALFEQKIDLIFTDMPVALYWKRKMNQEQNGRQLVVFEGPRDFPKQQLAIAVKKNDKMLLNNLNQSLAILMQQKAYQDSVDLYFSRDQ